MVMMSFCTRARRGWGRGWCGGRDSERVYSGLRVNNFQTTTLEDVVV